MSILWLNLAIVFTCSFLARYSANMQFTTSHQEIVKPNVLFTFFAMLSIVFVSGLRSNIGDTYFYMHGYSINHYTWDNVFESRDIGFSILQMFLKMLSEDPQILIFVTALITNVFIIVVLYKYSRMFELGVYVFITSGMHTTSMNGIRQYLAAAILFIATKYLIKGEFKKYALIVLIASTIHQSALILLPIYFIIRREAWTKVTFLLVALSIFVVIGFNYFSEILFSAIDDSQYGHYKDFAEGGANYLRVIVTAIPVIIAFIGRNKLKSLWPESDYIVNLSIINLVFMIIASQNWIFARFTIYFGLYTLILISWIVKLFREKDQKLIYFLILIFYFVFYFYEHVITFGTEYRSDYLSLF